MFVDALPLDSEENSMIPKVFEYGDHHESSDSSDQRVDLSLLHHSDDSSSNSDLEHLSCNEQSSRSVFGTTVETAFDTTLKNVH